MAQRLLLGVALVGVIPGANAFVPAVRGLPRGPSALPAFQLPTLELPDMSALFTGGDSSPKGPRASDVFELFDGGVDANSVAAACASSVTWVDLDASTPAEGPEAVAKLMEKKYEGATMVVDRVADGVRSSGATLYYDSEAGSGRRGTMYVEVDDAGLITFVQEAWEPLYKPGSLTADLLKAVTANFEKEDKEPTYAPRIPKGASDTVRYLWEEANPGGAELDVALDLFADDILYEDFNFEEPFVGREAVDGFLREFDFPGIEFVPERVSEGKDACAFTWRVLIGGEEGPKGVSFYSVKQGKVDFIRDIPAPAIKPPPLATLAAVLQPKLRVFKPRT